MALAIALSVATLPSRVFISLRHPDVTSVWDWGVGGACLRARALVAGAGGGAPIPGTYAVAG